MTQADLAERIGRAQTFVSKVEKGERRIDVIELIQVLTVMRANPVEFLRDSLGDGDRLRNGLAGGYLEALWISTDTFNGQSSRQLPGW